jgi:hypothetical protein
MPSVGEAIERMEDIDRSLPAEDGVRAFNELYLAVTRAVAIEAAANRFEDPEFLAALAGNFASRYFAALDAAGSDGASRAWEPVFEARENRKVAPLQFALAGMNAHINYDLCLALVETCRERSVSPRRESPQFRDHMRVGQILERVEEEVKERFLTGLAELADEALGRLDDVIAMWKVARAREAAWTNAETLWALTNLGDLRAAYLLTLSRIVGFAGRGLLVPVL